MLGVSKARFWELGVALLLAAAIETGVAATGMHVQLWDNAKQWTANNPLLLRTGVVHVNVASGPATEPAGPAPQLGSERDPFLLAFGDPGFSYHPFVDVAGTQFQGQPNDSPQRDYFGFRNPENRYFEPQPDVRYIVLTGNSEALGLNRDRPLSISLENTLSRRTGEKWKSLNLALNSYTTAQEIETYVNLAFWVRPVVVISHSFADDVIYGTQSPYEYRSLGLFYIGFQTTWAKQIHGSALDPRRFDQVNSLDATAYIKDGIEKNILRYKTIVEGNQGHFIWGVQYIDPSKVEGTPSEEAFKRAAIIERQLRTDLDGGALKVDYLDFNTFPGIDTTAEDPIHTTQASTDYIAEIYADRILAVLHR